MAGNDKEASTSLMASSSAPVDRQWHMFSQQYWTRTPNTPPTTYKTIYVPAEMRKASGNCVAIRSQSTASAYDAVFSKTHLAIITHTSRMLSRWL